MSTCKTCGKDKLEVDFYKSISTYCKTHWRERVKMNRLAKSDYYREYERKRSNLPHRTQARSEYRKTKAYEDSHAKSIKKYRKVHSEKYIAHTLLNNEIRAGRLTRLPCFICGEKAQAHHPDYSMPLDVVWLCDKHHKQAHAIAKK